MVGHVHLRSAGWVWVWPVCLVSLCTAQEPTSLEQLKAIGAGRSAYRTATAAPAGTKNSQPDLVAFQDKIKPVLLEACVECHGPDSQEGNTRIDTLDPDLLRGNDVARWLEVFAVVSNGEMPPADASQPGEKRLADDHRSEIVQWLSSEMQKASAARREDQPRSSFRRMTRYETNYALQDLLGEPFEFTKDLPPETTSDDGFQNSADMLHMSTNQLAVYRELALAALQKVTVADDKPPESYWSVPMQIGWNEAWARHETELKTLEQKHKGDPETLQREIEKKQAALAERPGQAYYLNLTTGQALRASWEYYNAKYARAPSSVRPPAPASWAHVAVIPPEQRLIVELGDTLPEAGTLRVRVRAARLNKHPQQMPALRLEFGWQASNDSQASVRIGQQDLIIDAPPEAPQFYQWDVPLCEIYPRNTMRKVWKMGDLPNPSEYLRLVNSSVSPGDIQIDYVEVIAPVYEQWPPASHSRIFFDSPDTASEERYAAEVLERFLSRAWRRKPTAAEVQQKVQLFKTLRTQYDRFQPAMLQVLATALASPKFLYITQADASSDTASAGSEASQALLSKGLLSETELATRLSLFLWCSLPDDELLQLAQQAQLRQNLTAQVNRMLADRRSRRFAEQFVRQWLGMQLLDYLKVDEAHYPYYDLDLKEAMQEEPIAFFQEVLKHNHSVLDFLHADYTLVNERLAQHYGLKDVYGHHFRRVTLDESTDRGGLLTQAGLLAMNSDGKDSHPLKRGIWLLKNLLNDPPPPPPPAVPVIDLADPEIAKMTIKQRMENHRNQPACFSCHAKIDPWGIAFENFDAVGNWRTAVQGQPIDASCTLANGQKLDGIHSLKGFLIEHRQDQFVRAMVNKLVTFALGRPLTFSDHAEIEKITASLRVQDDGLATMIQIIVDSPLFQSR